MAILTLKVADEVEQIYSQRAGGPGPGRKEMERALEKWAPFSLSQRLMIFAPEERAELEKLIGGPPNPTPKEVLERLKKMLSMDIAGISISLTEVQQRRLQAQAKGQGRDFLPYLQDRMKEAVRLVTEG